MQRPLLLLTLSLLLLSTISYSKDKDKLTKTEKLLIGTTWQIDSMKFGQGFLTKGRKKNKQNSAYFIRKHKGALLTFYEDWTVTYQPPADTNVYKGTWETYFIPGQPNAGGYRSLSYYGMTISFKGIAKRYSLDGRFWGFVGDRGHKNDSWGFDDSIHYFVFKRVSDTTNKELDK